MVINRQQTGIDRWMNQHEWLLRRVRFQCDVSSGKADCPNRQRFDRICSRTWRRSLDFSNGRESDQERNRKRTNWRVELETCFSRSAQVPADKELALYSRGRQQKSLVAASTKWRATKSTGVCRRRGSHEIFPNPCPIPCGRARGPSRLSTATKCAIVPDQPLMKWA